MSNVNGQAECQRKLDALIEAAVAARSKIGCARPLVRMDEKEHAGEMLNGAASILDAAIAAARKGGGR